jgi:hypothetical protein
MCKILDFNVSSKLLIKKGGVGRGSGMRRKKNKNQDCTLKAIIGRWIF